jgi:hypothetical protein
MLDEPPLIARTLERGDVTPHEDVLGALLLPKDPCYPAKILPHAYGVFPYLSFCRYSRILEFL